MKLWQDQGPPPTFVAGPRHSPYTKPEQVVPPQKVGSKKPVYEPGIVPGPNVRDPAIRQSHTTLRTPRGLSSVPVRLPGSDILLLFKQIKLA